MELNDNEMKMVEHLKNTVHGSTITCPETQSLSREWGVRMDRMASIMTEAGVKITDCMLGCFEGH